MSNVNPIKFGVAGNPYLRQDTKEDLTQNTGAEKKPEGNVNQQVNGGDVLGYMAAQSAAFVHTAAPKTVNVSDLIAKYNTPEQQARIASFVQGLVDDVDGVSATAQEEFGVSPEVADAIGMAYVDSTY